MCDKKKLEDALTQCFYEIDTDKSGSIDQGELENLLRAYFKHPDCPPEYSAQSSDADIKKTAAEFIADVDTSGDKKIQLKEFLGFFMKGM